MPKVKTSSIGDSLILLQINSLYTNGPEKQAVVCCDNLSPQFVKAWIIYEWMGNYASKVRNKALGDFDWLSQWLE